jgi:excisionase family DNA binding protein
VTTNADVAAPAGDGPWLTVAEVAALLRRSARTIRHWCRTGFLAGAKHVGRAWLIPESAVRALLCPETAAGGLR